MKLLIELTSDDGATVTPGRLATALRALSRLGVRVTGVEPLDDDAEALATAQHLRLSLRAEPLAARLVVPPSAVCPPTSSSRSKP